MAVGLLSTVGKVKGHFKTKENRVAKLLSDWEDLQAKMEAMTLRGSARTETSRMAYGVLVIMETGIRVGNEGSAEGWICENQIVNKKTGEVVWRHPLYGQHVQTFGLTTLLNQHVEKKRNSVGLYFAGKKLVDQTLTLRNRILVDYAPHGPDEDPWLGVRYRDLLKFVKKSVGRKFTPKDLRTAVVNLHFSKLFVSKYAKQYGKAIKKSERKMLLKEAIAENANAIGHTPSVSKSAYLSREMMDWIINGEPETVGSVYHGF